MLGTETFNGLGQNRERGLGKKRQVASDTLTATNKHSRLGGNLIRHSKAKRRSKMKRLVALSVLFCAFFVFNSSGVFAGIDPVKYMALKPGKWAIWQEVGSTSRAGYVTLKGVNGTIVREWYDNKGSGWTFDSSEIFEITPTAVLMIGSLRRHGPWDCRTDRKTSKTTKSE